MGVGGGGRSGAGGMGVLGMTLYEPRDRLDGREGGGHYATISLLYYRCTITHSQYISYFAKQKSIETSYKKKISKKIKKM